MTSGADGRIVVWDVNQGTITKSGRISESTVIGNAIRISPDGTVLAVGCDDNSIRFYDSSTLQQTSKFLGHSAAVTCLSFSADGQWLVSGSQDKSIRVWSVPTGNEITKLLGHSAPLVSVVFSSDGLRVLSASQDTTARLWDIGRTLQVMDSTPQSDSVESNASLGAVLSLEYHSSETTAAEFSPDGRTVMTASFDGKAVLWPSERISPSIRINNPNVTYKSEEGIKRIDPKAVLCQPGTFDLDGATIELKFESEGPANGRLMLDQSDGMFAIEGANLFYHAPKESPAIIGNINEVGGSRIQISLSKSANHFSVEQLIRHFAYLGDDLRGNELPLPDDVAIRIQDRNGGSGNAQPERVRISRIVEGK
jgi:hypothetical protein